MDAGWALVISGIGSSFLMASSAVAVALIQSRDREREGDRRLEHVEELLEEVHEHTNPDSEGSTPSEGTET